MIEFLHSFTESPFWVQIFVSLFIVLYCFRTMQKRHMKSLRIFPLIAGILASRAIVYFFYPSYAVYTISENIILIVYYFHLRMFTEKFTKDIVFYIINIFIILVLAAKEIPIVNQLLNLANYSLLIYWLNYIWLFFCNIFIVVNYYHVSEFNTEEGEVLMLQRRFLLYFPSVFYIFAAIVNFEQTFVHTLILPMYSLLHIFMIYRYSQYFDDREKENIAQQEATLNSAFDFMQNIGSAIKEHLEMNVVLQYVVETAVKNAGADSGAILMIDEFDDILRVRAVHGTYPPPYPVPSVVKAKLKQLKDYFSSTPIKVGETILGEVAQSGEAILVKDSYKDERLSQNSQNDALFISSLIAIPLVVGNKILGVLSVISKDRTKRFDDSDFEHIQTFGDYTSLTIDNLMTYMELLDKKEMEREVGIAADIQNQLLPTKLPKLKNADIFGYSVSAKGVSGDYYDVIPIPRGRTALVMCDVAGKGVPASLVMVMIRTIVHLVAGANKSVANILTWVNKGIAGRIALDRFATMCFLTYDQNTRHIEYSNAAHHPLLIYRAANMDFESFDTEGIPIGLEKNSVYGQQSMDLYPGDIIILYTDGIIEAMNVKNEQYSLEALEKIIKKNYTLTPKEIVELILQDIDEFVGKAKQHDDQTILVMKVDH